MHANLASFLLLTGTAMVTAVPNTNLIPRASTIKQALAIDFPDPTVFYDGVTYWAFGTNSTDGKVNVQIASSPDFETWTFHPGQDAMPSLSTWYQWADDPPFVWAPSVMQNDNYQYVMYFTAASSTALTKHCIGVATSWNVTGPYTSYPDPLVCPVENGGPGAIDPSFFQDADGTRYILYKIDGNSNGGGVGPCHNYDPTVPTTLMLQQVDRTGLVLVGDPVALLDIGPLDGPLIEAPSLVLVDGTYTLFFSSNCYTSKFYDISYAMASNIRGPYTKHGPFATAGSTGLYAPGGAMVNVYDPTQMIFHAGPLGSRFLYTARIAIDGKAKFVTGGA